MAHTVFGMPALLAGVVLSANLFAAGSVAVQTVPNLPPDFIMGADVSTLDQVEAAGGKFYNLAGQQQDALAILKANGVNWLRLRLWHTPVNAADVIEDGKVIAHKGDPVGGGNNDLATTLRLAKRAKALKLKYLLDIHYSDCWADPLTQTKPAAWQDLHGAALEKAVYDYTATVMRTLDDAGVAPDMVQVGNELNGGFMWPDGKTWKAKPDEVIGGDAGFVALMRQGIAAIRADDARFAGRHTRIAVHLANGTSNDLYRRVFDLLTREKVDFDIIGLSYYPYLHGGVADLRANMDDMAFRYAKPVAVLETSYAATLQNGDSTPNIFNADSQKVIGYKATPQGQASLVRDVIDAVAQVPAQRGLGLFYWEPAWLPNVGWRTGDGNGWDNQIMFDFGGHALPSLAVFKRVREKSAYQPKLLQPGPIELSAFVGEPFVPPETLRLPFSDDAERPVLIDWASVPAGKTSTPGEFTLKGEITGQPDVTAHVTVSPRRNLFTDASFENGKLDDWALIGDKSAASNERNPGNAHSGQQSLHYWASGAFKFEASHTFTGLKPGVYHFKAWAAGGGGEKSLTLFAKDCGSEAQSVAMHNNGWQQWHSYQISNIKVSGEQCTVGVAVDANAGNWGNVDDVEFAAD
ncbi:glycosyl hydrolase 53 family protein [Silvimonas iriomotensis]|uniref:Arabinogalactan endo-beta-1,4-galactanase n=1 Tax=Silvimonas iriomotensis TaxID=449662 RepID=A0ABQ2P8S8_9NEIS|nr:glycosyl hydrolase 53 family protein [Silvimonas iriomotensis]GGP21103.1 arabinogalactan endo-beta-1,4-galactanase [Silvimonas iriomotensis]